MPDSQLVNSVYLDSPALELYHGRLNKTPGAVALRLRWYGTGEPTLVFVERKTHRDSWTGDGSVKDCVEIKFYGAESRRPPRHRGDACSMAWRCLFLTARRSQHGSVIADK